MLPAAVGILSLATIVFFVGMISARNAARKRARTHHDILAVPAADLAKENPDKAKNQENPEAMAMASGGARQHQ